MFILVTKFYQPFANIEKVERSVWSLVKKAVDRHEIVMMVMVVRVLQRRRTTTAPQLVAASFRARDGRKGLYSRFGQGTANGRPF